MEKQPQTLEEKIKLSEILVDKYLDEFVTAAGVMAATSALAVGQGLAKDAVGVANWTKRKMEERKKRKLLAKQERDKKLQQAALAKQKNNA